MKQKKHLAIVGSMLLALTACSGGSSELDPTPKPAPAAKVPINISTSILSRATDLAFEAGDQIGLFVVNHQADGSAATLQTTGNYIDNTKFTYDGTWKAATQTYWKDNSTPRRFLHLLSIYKFYQQHRGDALDCKCRPEYNRELQG